MCAFRNRTPRIPSYCVHKSRNQAYVRLGEDMIYLGPPHSPESREKYDRLIAEWIQAGRTYVNPDVSDGLNVNGVLLAYRRHCEQVYVTPEGLNEKEIERINLAMRPVMNLYGTVPAVQFGPKALKAVVGVMIESELHRRTINQRIGIIKRAFRWAASEELIPAFISQGLSTVEGLRKGRSKAPDGRTVGTVGDHILDAVMKFLPPMLRAMVKLHNITGMRSGELCIMRTGDIETSADGAPWLYRPQKHKTMNRNHQRVVPLGPQAQEIIKPYLRNDLNALLFSPVEVQKQRNAQKRALRKTPVQPSQICRKKNNPKKTPGESFTSSSYRRALDYATRQAIKAETLPVGTHWHPHQLRHNAATRIRRKLGLDAVRAVLGHRTVVQSAEYAELDTELDVATAAKIG
jgi:integrase